MLSIPFLGSALSSSLVYIWSRRNPETRLSFLGLLVFTAPYLPWVLMAFSLVLHGTVPKDEICGVIVGHSEFSIRCCVELGIGMLTFFLVLVWYFFSDVYPSLHGGQRPLDPPQFWRNLFERPPADTGAVPINNEIAAAAAPEVR